MTVSLFTVDLSFQNPKHQKPKCRLYTLRINTFISFLFSQNILDSRPEQTKKDDVLESLITDVNEPWIKHFLTNSLEMAINGEKGILTSDQDGEDYDKGDFVFICLYLLPV